MLEFKNIEIKFENKVLFQELNFTINSGDKVLLKGKSGIGKSTIFNLILGFMYPNQGVLYWNNQKYSPKIIKEVRNNTSWLPQNTNMFSNITTADMIKSLFKSKINTDKAPNDSEIIRYAEKYSLSTTDIYDKAINTLSGGENQRVFIIASLFLKRKLTLMDEPTSALDENISNIIMEDIISCTDTLILISHNSKYDAMFNKIIQL